MLRRSRKSLFVTMHPDRLVVGILQRKLARLDSGLIIDCGSSAGTSWKSAVEALNAAMSEHAQPGMDVGIVLSHRLCRYGWTPAVTTVGESEAQTLARHSVEKANGTLDGEWSITLSDAPPNRPRIACAVSTELIAELHDIARKHGCRLTSVRPLLSAHFNARRKLIKENRYWFVSTDVDRCCIGRIEGRHWLSLNTYRTAMPDLELPKLLHRESMLAATEDVPTTVVIAPSANAMTLLPKWTAKHLAPSRTIAHAEAVDPRIVSALETCLQ